MDIIEFLTASFGGAATWPKPLHLIQGALRVRAGESVQEAARAVRTNASSLSPIVSSPDPVSAVLGVHDAGLTPEEIAKVRRNVGQMLLGRAAEIAFEDIYRSEVNPTEFKLDDLREGRSNTDYFVLNGGDRKVFRLNIKFIGTVFRRGAEMVGLQPNDCFPLATYKIHAALMKQEEEHLPYVFAVVGVPDLAASIADAIPDDEVRMLALLFASEVVTRKHELEDRFVDRIVAVRSPAFTGAYDRIRSAPWYILSARRAFNLMRENLYQRVYALRVPGFTRQFGRAEVDMHFSLSQDLVSLHQLLLVLRQDGQMRVASMLERGSY